MVRAIHIPTNPLWDERINRKRMLNIATDTIEYAEYAKSDAPKLTPSNTKAKALIGWVPATNGIPTPMRRRTSLSLVKSLAPNCSPVPSMAAKTKPRASPN